MFPNSSSRVDSIFYLIHIDLCGPYKTPTFNKKYYFFIVADDYSRYAWIYLLQLKTEVIVSVKSFLAMVKTQFGVIVKVIMTYNGTECFNSQCCSLFQDLGIVYQINCVHTSQQNGAVGRKHRHILNIARALRFQYRMPIRYWGICIQTIVYLLNRLNSVMIQGRNPYELLYKKKPSLTDLRVIGCLCYASNVH